MMGIVSIAAIFLGVLTLVWLSLRWRRQDRDRRWQRIREAADVERETYARVRMMEQRSMEHLLTALDNAHDTLGDLEGKIRVRATTHTPSGVTRRTHTTQPNGRPWTKQDLDRAEFSSDGSVFVPPAVAPFITEDTLISGRRDVDPFHAPMFDGGASGGAGGGASWEAPASSEPSSSSYDSGSSSSDSGSSFDSGGGSGSND